MRHQTKLLGFTLVELLVVMGVASLMMFLIHRIFFGTAEVVGQGIRISGIIQGARPIGEQLETDANAMIGPDESGFLVIFNKTYPNVPILDRDGDDSQPDGLRRRDVRSDQLVFIRYASDVFGDKFDIEPLVPGNDNSFSNSSGAQYARIWYGHLRRTNPDPDQGCTDSFDLGDPCPHNPNCTPRPGRPKAQPACNQVATNWILGRQALFLDGSVPCFSVHASYLDSEWSVLRLFEVLPSQPRPFFLGEADVLNINLIPPSDPSNPCGFNGSVKESLDDFTDPFAYNRLVYQFAFGEANKRLRVNPTPSDNEFTSQQIGQMHAYFAANVSDFEVAFAADVNNNGRIDTSQDGNPDDDQGEIFWYQIGARPRRSDWQFNMSGPVHVAPGFPNADIAFVFRHDNDGSKWPHLIRLRYRIHDPLGKLKSSIDNKSGRWFELIIRVKRP